MVQYMVAEAALGRCFGLTGRDGRHTCTAAPFTGERESAERLARQLEAEQVPLERFRELALSGRLPELAGTGNFDLRLL